MRATGFIPVLVCLAWVGGAGIAPAAGAGGLFLPAPALAAQRSGPASSATVLERRTVRVAPDFLPDETSRAGEVVTLNLFDDLVLDALLDRLVLRGRGDYTWFGHLVAGDAGSLTLTVYQDVVLVNVRAEKAGVFQVRYLGGGVHEVQRLDASSFPRCGADDMGPVRNPDKAGGQRGAPKAGATGELFDVLTVYTPAARLEAGGTAAIEAVARMALDEANEAYRLSGIPSRLRLVHLQEVAYTETASPAADLNALRATADGQADEVHPLRDAHGADMVCMLGVFSNTCGRAFTMDPSTFSTNFAQNAFSIVTWDCAIGNYSFVHELAHNMGCRHEAAVNTGTPLFPYSFGWAFDGLGGLRYRTIMGTTAAGGTRIQFFSNPAVDFDGVATGVAPGDPDQADNALSINNAAPVASAWRDVTHALDVLPVAGSAASGPLGGPFTPVCRTLSLTNLGDAPLTWTASHTAGWLSLAPTNGLLAAGAAAEVQVCIEEPARFLARGVYESALLFSNVTSGFRVERGMTLHVGAVAQMPFTEDFESGALAPWWTVSGTRQYRSRVTGANGPHGGAWHLTLDDTFGGNNSFTSRNEVTLAVDLADYTNVVLTFWAREFGDEANGPPPEPFIGGADFDGVAVSVDGSNWYEVTDLRSGLGVYTQRTVDLDAELNARGLWYNGQFRIRFNQYDNWPIPSDGIAIDDISLAGDALRLDPPVLFGVIRQTGPDRMVIYWPGRVGAVYSLARSAQPDTGYTVLASNLAAATSFTFSTDTVTGIERAFYSVTRNEIIP